jgi:hypothetical protein
MSTELRIVAILLTITVCFGCQTESKQTEAPSSRLEHKRQTRARISELQLELQTELGKLYGTQLTVPGKAPKDWPQRQVTWRPLRHFGPWTYGSDFEQIQVLLNGEKQATWYFNNYFVDMPAEKQLIYKKYYRTNYSMPLDNVQLPRNQTSALQHIPGGIPTLPTNATVCHANDILLSLYRVDPSSRYGGSIRMRFRLTHVDSTDPQEIPWHKEDFEYELACKDNVTGETTRFDFRDLEMSVYVNPVAARFNPTRTSMKPKTYVEFDPIYVTTYKNDRRVTLDPSTREALADCLSQFEASVVQTAEPQAAKLHASNFVHGFLHDQFQTELGELTGDDEGVDKILISDNFVDVYTSIREAVLALRFRITGTKLWALEEEEHNRGEPGDTAIQISARHIYEGGGEAVIDVIESYLIDVLHDDRSYFAPAGMWLLTECNPLESVIIDSKIFGEAVVPTGPEPPAGVEDIIVYLEGSAILEGVPPIHLVPPDCAGMQSWVNSDRYGMYGSPLTGTQELFYESGLWAQFHFTWEASWWLGRR